MPKSGGGDTASGHDSRPGPDTQSPDDSGKDSRPPDSGHTAETAETADSAAPWDPNAPLELCINEFMPDNGAALVNEDTTTPDWIELHNPGPADIALDGWTLSDEADTPAKHILTGGLVLPVGGFLLLFADALPELGPQHLSFSLSAAGGEVGVYAPDGRGQRIVYGVVSQDFSVARQPDCCTEAGCIQFLFRGTPGATNGAPPAHAGG